MRLVGEREGFDGLGSGPLLERGASEEPPSVGEGVGGEDAFRGGGKRGADAVADESDGAAGEFFIVEYASAADNDPGFVGEEIGIGGGGVGVGDGIGIGPAIVAGEDGAFEGESPGGEGFFRAVVLEGGHGTSPKAAIF